VIPGNDDALRAIRLFTSRIADAVSEGRGLRESAAADAPPSGGEGAAEAPRRGQGGAAVARQRREPAATATTPA
jgi:small subunit ribosomal protein S2